MLLGRITELNYLNNCYDREGSQILIVYGQKYIGKTELVKEFMKDRPHYYYLARACSEREQVYQWGRQMAHEGYVVDKFPTFHEILAKISHRINGKKVIVIDEFQNIVKASESFMKELVSFVHSQWNRDNVMVLLCSSSIGWIENSMITRIGEVSLRIVRSVKNQRDVFFGYCGALSEFSYRGVRGSLCNLRRDSRTVESV